MTQLPTGQIAAAALHHRQRASISVSADILDPETGAIAHPVLTHHYEAHRDFHQPWIARHPRRTGEAYIAQYLEARFIDDNPAPSTDDIDALQRWHLRFSNAEAGLS